MKSEDVFEGKDKNVQSRNIFLEAPLKSMYYQLRCLGVTYTALLTMCIQKKKIDLITRSLRGDTFHSMNTFWNSYEIRKCMSLHDSMLLCKLIPLRMHVNSLATTAPIFYSSLSLPTFDGLEMSSIKCLSRCAWEQSKTQKMVSKTFS